MVKSKFLGCYFQDSGFEQSVLFDSTPSGVKRIMQLINN